MSNYSEILAKIEQAANASAHPHSVKLVAVSKTRPAEEIRPLIEEGHRLFGENRVQEAKDKWPALKEEFPDISLRLIGGLQSNKLKYLPKLFDCVDSVDREDILDGLAKLADKHDYHPECLIQLNTGEEPQKAGVSPKDLDALIRRAKTLDIKIQGLMCIPPQDEEASIHFAFLKKLCQEYALTECSMGMSQDFDQAIALGSSMVRVGTALFGSRN